MTKEILNTNPSYFNNKALTHNTYAWLLGSLEIINNKNILAILKLKIKKRFAQTI